MQELLEFLKDQNSKPSRLHLENGVWKYPVLDEEKVTLEVKTLPEHYVEFAEEASKL
jgi:hypothetical protein